MDENALKQKAREIAVGKGTAYAWLQQLIVDGFFDSPVSSREVTNRVAELFGRRWSTSSVQVYIRKFVGIINAVKPKGSSANYWVLASISRVNALQSIGKARRVLEIEHELLAPDLTKKLEKDFSRELSELQTTFGKCGNSTAFLLRKILEKLLIIVFRKVGKGPLIEDNHRPGRLIGLEAMVDLAMRERVNAAPVLSGRTGTELKGIKFLGDTAAHNPLVNVDVADILPQMPYIIIAYKELAAHV